MENNYGLLTEKYEPVPLKQVEVAVQVQGHVASVTAILQCENKDEGPVRFLFPLEGEATVCHFSAKIGETELMAELRKEQEDFLPEESWTVLWQGNLGSLPPGEKVSVTLSYVTELTVQADDALKFCLPAFLNPRYTPQDSGSVPQVTSFSDGSVPCTLSLSVHLWSPSPISKVESNCPLQPLKYLNTEKTQATVSLSPGHMFDRDVELLAYYSGAHQPTAIVEKGQPNAKSGSFMGDSVVMLSIYPEFPAAVTSSLDSRGEFLFLVDQSSSMDNKLHFGEGAQTPINITKETLLLLLKSLPIGCFFNIYGFGSTHKSFFPKSVEYSQETVDQALEKVGEMWANQSTTEIISLLTHIYSQPCLPEHPRQLFIFTDGELSNTKKVLELVKMNAFSHRCFFFVMENSPNTLIKGIEKEGSDQIHVQVITGTDRLQPKVMQSLRLALQPVEAISVKWNVPKGVSVTPLFPPINVLFQGQRPLLYAQLTGEFQATDGSVSLQYRLGEQSVQNQLSFSVKPGEDTGLTIHRLGARTLIRTLETELGTAEQDEQKGRSKEEAECLRKRVLELSVQSGVSSVLTKFIAVHAGSAHPTKGSLVGQHVPTPRVVTMFPRLLAWERHMERPGEPPACYHPPSRYEETSIYVTNDDGELVEKKVGILKFIEPPKPPKDFLHQLISLQKATGSWNLVLELAEVFGKTEEEVAKQTPTQVESGVWATFLALLWLYGFRGEYKDEWQFVAMKAASWIRAQKGGSVSQCVQAGNTLLGCQVQEGTLGL